MKKFLKTVIAFLLIVSVITLGINWIFIKLDRSDPEYIEKFNEMPATIQLCNFGSSHGLYDLDYQEYPEIGCFNFALSSQSLSYDKRLFDTYESHISDGAVVFIIISYFSLYGNGETTDKTFPEKNRRYYQILPPEQIKAYDRNTDFYVHYFPSLIARTNLLKVLTGKSVNTNEEIRLQSAAEIDLASNVQKTAVDHILTNKFDKDQHRVIDEEEVLAVKELIMACKEKGAVPILVTTPYLKEYTDKVSELDPAFYPAFYELVDQIAAETDTPYYDYAFDERFSGAYDLFFNCDHLNKTGSLLFTKILLEETVHYGSEDSLLTPAP